jgi:uncharacterized repeat protein (TIGR01451 family)/fimbrial isopeptide formation D2 family protein
MESTRDRRRSTPKKLWSRPGILTRCLVWVALALVAAVLSAPSFSQTIPTGYQEYYVTGNDSHIWQMFNLVASGEGQPAFPGQAYSVIGVACSSANQAIYYDQWEDGLEADLLHPVQSTTLVLGDGNPSNGDAHDFNPAIPVSADILQKGSILTFNSDQPPPQSDTRRQWVPMPRVASDVRFDGGDRILCSGGPLTMVHYQRPNTQLIAGSCETLSRQAVSGAYSYSVPVGTNTYTRYGGNGTAGSPFKYVYLDLVAFEDDTHVYIDNKGGGTASFTLMKGQHYGSPGWIDQAAAPSVTILEGTKVSTDKPITGLVFTGGSNTWQTRFYALLPDLMHGTDFVTTAPGPASTTYRMNLYIYNPSPSSITVNLTDSFGTTAVSVPANQVRAYTELPAPRNQAAGGPGVPPNSTVRLTSGSNFWGISAYDYASNITEWGHSWLATKFLSNVYSVSWSPGTSDPAGSFAARGSRGCNGVTPCDSLNRSPIWISALENNTRIQIDYNNDGVYDQIDTNSDDVPEAAPLPSNTYTLNAGQCLRVYDWTDYDNTGTQVVANKPVAVAFGQDSDQGQGSDPTLDLGNTVFPLIQRWLDPVLTLDMASDTGYVSGSSGGDVIFTLTLKAYSSGPMTNLQISDLLPTGMTYVSGSTVVTYPGGGTSTADPTQAGSLLTWSLSPDSMNANDTLTVQFTGHLPAGAAAIFRNSAQVNGTLGSSTFSPTASLDIVRTNVTLSKAVNKTEATPGESLLYTITVTNSGSTETGVTVTDPLPADTIYTPPLPTPPSGWTGQYNAAQNAVIWTNPSFPAGSATLSFNATIHAAVEGGTVIPNRASYESTQTPYFKSNGTATVITVAATLSIAKTGPAQAFNGDRVTFDITVANTGNGSANNLVISDPFSANATYAPETMQYSINGGAFTPVTDSTSDGDPGYAYATRLELHLATLASGSTVVFRFQSDVTGSYPGLINNQATVSCSNVVGKDSNLVQVQIVRPDLSLSQKEVVDLNDADVEPGDVLEFTITLIESSGQVAATGVSVTDTLSPNLENLVVVSDPDGAFNASTASTLNITGITVPAGGSATIVFRATVVATAVAGDTIANTATVTDPKGPGATPSSPTLVVRQSVVPSSGTKPLYLRSTGNNGAPYFLSRTPPTNTNNRFVTLDGNTATPNRQWNLGALYAGTSGSLTVQGVIQVPLSLTYRESNSTIRVSLYYNAGSGNTLMGQDSYGPIPLGTNWRTFNLTAAGYSQVLPAGTTLMLEVAETNNRKTDVYYDMTTRNSRVLLPCVNVITVDSVAGYNAAYSGGSIPAYFDPGDTVHVRTVISDPFGSGDVTGARLTLVNPSGSAVFSDQAMTPVYDSGTSTKTYELAYTVTAGQPRGIWTAKVTAIEGTESPSPATDPGLGTFAVRLHAPTVSGPIAAGASSITGTSDEPVGTTITVYRDGVSIGTTTVQSDGTWTLTGVAGLAGGESITARAGTGASQSAVSNTVVVTPAPPVVNSPILAEATTVSGTSTAPVGSTITVYQNGVSIGTTTVQSGGTWSLSGIATPLAAGDSVKATVTAGGQASADSNVVTVQHQPPVVSGPIVASPFGNALSGTSASPVGSTITVYQYGVSIGTTTVQSDGMWTLTGVTGLAGGESITATAGTGGSQSAVSNTVVVTPAPPVVDSPILAGATTVSGTSTAPAGSTITVYKNGASIGVTTVQADGTWILSGIGTPPADGETIKATVSVGGQTSADSNLVMVSANTPDVTPPPWVTSPIYAGAVRVSGTSTSPEGTRIDVFVDGVWVGNTTVSSMGTWTWNLPAGSTLRDGQAVFATATDEAHGLGTSVPSPEVLVSAGASDRTPSPVIGSPVYGGATSVNGTSSSPEGIRIDVYADGVFLGTTTVQSDGSWSLAGVGPLQEGTVLQATATDEAGGHGTSTPSAPVTVLAVLSTPPIVSASLLAGASQTITGSSVEAAGSVITVYVNGGPVGTTTVNADGSWSLAGAALTSGDLVKATVQASGKSPSGDSNVVMVSVDASGVTPPPVITPGIPAGSTTVSGTSVPGATVDVYADGLYLGTVTADPVTGEWTLPGIDPLADGAILSATATAPCPGTCTGTSNWSAPVVVGTAIHLLRSDALTSLSQNRRPLFTHDAATPPYPSLETIGPNHAFNAGEGSDPLQPAAPSSGDDDKAYLRNVTSGTLDPDGAVLTDDGRPLVFYELLDNNAKILKLAKSGPSIQIIVE